MFHQILSPLAIVGALAVLYPPLNHAGTEVASLSEEFVTEEFALESLSDLENDNIENEFSLIPSEKEESFLSLIEDEVEPEKSPPSSDSISPSTPASMQMSSQSEIDCSCFWIGGNYAYTHIKPHDSASFHGNLGGAQISYAYRPLNRFYGAVKASWRQGETTASSSTRFLVDVTAEERLGYTLAVYDNKWITTFFSGFGYRFLGHHLTQSHQDSMRFNYNEFYVPVGIFTDYQMASWFSCGLHATWMPQIFPTVTIIPLKGARWKTTCTYGNTLVELPLTFSSERFPSWFLSFKPTFQYWKDGHTTAKTSTGEALDLPSNTYLFWGADLNLGYSF
jgi:hypothetical protein